jgi:aspartokinase
MFQERRAVALIVQKYGGSSVADAASIKRVAQRIVAQKKAGYDVVVAVSAMGDSTDELLELAERQAELLRARRFEALDLDNLIPFSSGYMMVALGRKKAA